MTERVGAGGRTAADRLCAFARDIAAQPDSAASVSRAIVLAPEVVGCHLVDIVRVRSSGGLRVVGSIDPDRSEQLAGLSEAMVEGPARFCRSVMGTAVVTDLRGDARWSRYAARVLPAAGFRSEMDIGLDVAEGDPLVLRMFSEQIDAWSDDDRTVATAFAELAALAIDRAELRTTTQNLREALASNRMIGAATGILMARHHVTYEVAFDLLRSASQRSNRKLSDVADDVFLTGDLPGRQDLASSPVPKKVLGGSR